MRCMASWIKSIPGPPERDVCLTESFNVYTPESLSQPAERFFSPGRLRSGSRVDCRVEGSFIEVTVQRDRVAEIDAFTCRQAARRLQYHHLPTVSRALVMARQADMV